MPEAKRRMSTSLSAADYAKLWILVQSFFPCPLGFACTTFGLGIRVSDLASSSLLKFQEPLVKRIAVAYTAEPLDPAVVLSERSDTGSPAPRQAHVAAIC